MNEWISLLGVSAVETLYMTLISSVSSFLLGIVLGIALVLTSSNGLMRNKTIYAILNFVINVLRSVPFLILMVAIQPFTKSIVGTYVGLNATIVPLIVAATPFVARLVESSIKEIDYGIIEAALSMGASTRDIVLKVMIGESKPSLMRGFTVTTITILGYSAMAGIFGGGGLGSVAINYGMYKFNPRIMWSSIVFLLLLVEILQRIGMAIASKIEHRRQ